jgi:DNA-binding XRE family transcriptional regulator
MSFLWPSIGEETLKKLEGKELKEMRQKLETGIEDGTLSLGEATRMMRRIVGMNRREYAARIAKVGHDALQNVETGNGNPTLKTLRAIGAPFGLEVGFVKKRGDS